MRYLYKRVFEIAQYFAGWRIAVVIPAFVLTLLAIDAESQTLWYLGGATFLLLLLFGTTGARVVNNHRELRDLRRQIDEIADSSRSSTLASAKDQPQSSPSREEKVAVAQQQEPLSVPGPSHDRPQVSIVVTAFNERDYLLDCLESIRRQTWRSFECIVVDDHSTDDTLDIAFDGFSKDPRFRFITVRKNSGLSVARNIGLHVAAAEWVTFVDGDDFLYEAAIESRMATLASHLENHWIAGAYCNWAPVPQNEPLTAKGEDRPSRRRISWLDALHDAPFIASAPLVRTNVIRAMGGFRQVDAAEDADMWTKVLRHGYVFLPTRYTGIAYRQKANSMFRRETVEHASVTVGLYESNYQAYPASKFVLGTPFHYTEAAPTYIVAAESFRRNLVALTTAVAQGDDVAIQWFVELLDLGNKPYLPWVVDVEQVVKQAARRSESYDKTGAGTRSEILAQRTLSTISKYLEPTASYTPTEYQPSPQVRPTTMATAAAIPWAPVRERQRVHLPSRELGREIRNHVVMTPSAAYHIDELGPLAEELATSGIPVAFMVSDRRWSWTEPGLRSWDFPVYAFPEDTEWTAEIAAIVTLNDWGEEPHAAIVAANHFGTPTFAKVEGVQDFDDVDVPRTRNPYRTASHVLCQGSNDEKALSGQADTYVVGNSRLESIWQLTPQPSKRDLAVVNLNFTWGVLEEAREMWVESVVAATKDLSYPTVFSIHPAEKNRPSGVETSELPMRHLLTQATVLISRFSTVPFEAMARGVPFIYHNPHNEQVPTFRQPEGAFDVTTSAVELGAAIENSRKWLGGYRDRSEAFFKRQIDIDPSASPAVRSARVIASFIRPAGSSRLGSEG
jgi:glycosyltransferase involved in cell wall biosynthesis